MLLFLTLTLIGFGIGLSGALIPGPLLAFTIRESLKYGIKTGFLVITGHAFIEIIVVLMVVLGFFKLISSALITGIFGIAGSLVLFYLGIDLLKHKDFSVNNLKENYYGPVFGGMVLTVFNPSFPLWWATVGYKMLSEGLFLGGILGVIFILTGHWIADFGWYTLVSVTITKGKDVILKKRIYPVLRITMAFFMFLLGIYFLFKGFKDIKTII